MTARNIIGKRYKDLEVIAEAGKNKHRTRMLICRCLKCGTITEPKPYTSVVNRGITCGSPTCRYKHGESRTRLYRIWSHIKQKCFNRTDHQYKKFGALGITMCEEWDLDFRAFRDWALANGYTDEMTVSRRDKKGGYNPENCYVRPSKYPNSKESKTNE